jgi:hypothetical protein
MSRALVADFAGAELLLTLAATPDPIVAIKAIAKMPQIARNIPTSAPSTIQGI